MRGLRTSPTMTPPTNDKSGTHIASMYTSLLSTWFKGNTFCYKCAVYDRHKVWRKVSVVEHVNVAKHVNPVYWRFPDKIGKVEL